MFNFLNKNKNKKKQSGFTLIELLVVIAIVGLLSSMVLVAVNNARKKARDAKRIADMHQIALALELFFQDHADVPGPNEGIPEEGQKIGVGESIDAALSPYLGKVPKDPLDDGVNYYYAYDPSHCISLLQCGEDMTDTLCSGDESKWQTVISVHKFEVTPLSQLERDTCQGTNQDINNSNFNIMIDVQNSAFSTWHH